MSLGEKKKKKVMVVTLVSLSLLHINYCLQQKQQLQQINKTWTKQARQLQLKEAVKVPQDTCIKFLTILEATLSKKNLPTPVSLP